MLQLRTLGGLSLRAADGKDHPLQSQSKRLGLLVYLAAAKGGGYRRRDQLMALFWPELDGDHARGALRQAVYILRRELGERVVRSRGEDEIGVDPDALWFDVTAFTSAMGEGRARIATDLYQGDFLDAFFVAGAAPEFDEWVGAERQRLRALASRAMWMVAEDSIPRDPAAAIDAIRRAITLAPDDEIALRRALGQLARLGDRAGALQLYQGFRERLHQEYRAQPSTETKAIGQALQRSGDPEPSGSELQTTPTPAEHVAGTGTSPLEFPATPLDDSAIVEVAAHPLHDRTWQAPIALLVAAVTFIAIFVGASRWNEQRSLTLSGQVVATDDLLVADVNAPAPDSLAARAIAELLRSSLVGTPAIRVVTRESQDETLRSMLLPINTRLTDSVAREVAVRNGYEAVLFTQLVPLGRGFVLTSRLITAQGAELATVTQRATSADGLIAAVDRLARSLRSRLGESRTSLVRVPPLQQVTTRSLKALALFTQAQEESRVHGQQPPRVLALLKAAIAVDSTFAMAQRRLGAAYFNLGLVRESMAAFRAAERFSDRSPDVDRLTVQMYVHGNSGDPERAAADAHELLRQNPKSPNARNQLPVYRFVLGQYDRVDSELRALGVPNSVHQISTWLYQGKQIEALDMARESLRNANDSTWVNSVRAARQRMARLHASLFAYDSAEFYALPVSATDSGSPVILAAGRAARGQLTSALSVHGSLARNRDVERHNTDERAALESFAALAIALVADDRVTASRHLDQVASDSTYRAQHPANRPIRPVLAMALTGRSRDARRELLNMQQAADSDVVHARKLDFEFARGAVALSERRTSDAITSFTRASTTMMFGSHDTCRVCALPWLGHAYDQANQRDSALAVYERYLVTGDPFRFVSDALWRARILQRLGELHAQRGDRLMATKRLAEFTALWKHADRELQPAVARAERRMAMLQGHPADALGASRKANF